MDIERIKFERTGGFAGIRLAADFKLDDLPSGQAHTLADLLDNMAFNELPESFGNKNTVPDGFTYEITVETKQWTHTVTTGEVSSPENLETLLTLLNQIARELARKK
jgi:hypothetical protein